MNITYKFNESETLDYQELSKLFHTNADWLMPTDLNEWKELVTNTPLRVTAYDDGKLIGFAKLFTDFVRWGQIYDVVVDKNYHGQGIGKELIRSLIDHELVKRVRTIWLGTVEEKVEFYEKLGFQKGSDIPNAHSLFLCRKHRDGLLSKKEV